MKMFLAIFTFMQSLYAVSSKSYGLHFDLSVLESAVPGLMRTLLLNFLAKFIMGGMRLEMRKCNNSIAENPVSNK